MRICNQQEQITKYLSYDDTNILYETEKLKKENQYATVCEAEFLTMLVCLQKR